MSYHFLDRGVWKVAACDPQPGRRPSSHLIWMRGEILDWSVVQVRYLACNEDGYCQVATVSGMSPLPELIHHSELRRPS